jgi:hypothetical protein
MRQSLSWIDVDAMRATFAELAAPVATHPLAELARPPKRPEASAVPAQTAPASGPTVSSAPVSTPASPVSAPAATLAPSSFVPPDGAISERMVALLAWVGRRLGTTQAFMADQDGLALVAEDTTQELIAVSAWLMTSWEKAQRFLGGQGGNSALFELAPGRSLLLLTVRAPWGLCGLGIGLAAAPDPLAVAEVKQALAATITA